MLLVSVVVVVVVMVVVAIEVVALMTGIVKFVDKCDSRSSDDKVWGMLVMRVKAMPIVVVVKRKMKERRGESWHFLRNEFHKTTVATLMMTKW